MEGDAAVFGDAMTRIARKASRDQAGGEDEEDDEDLTALRVVERLARVVGCMEDEGGLDAQQTRRDSFCWPNPSRRPTAPLLGNIDAYDGDSPNLRGGARRHAASHGFPYNSKKRLVNFTVDHEQSRRGVRRHGKGGPRGPWSLQQLA